MPLANGLKERAKETLTVRDVSKTLRGSIPGLRSAEYLCLDVEPVAQSYEEALQDLIRLTPRLNAGTVKKGALHAFDVTAGEAETFGARFAKVFQTVGEKARKVKDLTRTPGNSAFNRLVQAYWKEHVRPDVPGEAGSHKADKPMASLPGRAGKDPANEASLPGCAGQDPADEPSLPCCAGKGPAEDCPRPLQRSACPLHRSALGA